MKNSTQLFSTVSLLVLLSTTPDNLWAMTNGTEEGNGTTTVAVKTPEAEKKDALASKSNSWWPFGWGTSETPEDASKDGTVAMTHQNAAKEAEALKDATLIKLGMTRDQFENATATELEAQLNNDALSANERKFLEEAINAKTQHQELSLTASTLAAASPEELKQLSQDQDLSPAMQSLATSALEVKKQGGTEEEQAAKIVAKATEEWGMAATTAYYTLGAPVTLPYELIKGLYNMGARIFSGSTAAEPQKESKTQEALSPTGNETPSLTDQKTEVTTTDQESSLTNSEAQAVSVVTNESQAPAINTKKKKKKKAKTPEQKAEIRKAAEQARQKEEEQKLLEKAAQKALESEEERLRKELKILLEKLNEVRSEKAQQDKGKKGLGGKKH